MLPSRRYGCTVMFLHNLAKTEWVSVSCWRPLAENVYCVKQELLPDFQDLQQGLQKQGCPTQNVLKNKTCLQFSWLQTTDISNMNKFCGNTPPGKRPHHIESYQFLFDAIAVPMGPFFTADMKLSMTYARYSNTFVYAKDPVLQKSTKGFYVCTSAMLPTAQGANIFICDNNISMAITVLCDGVSDCPGENAADEAGCNCNEPQSPSTKCKYIVSNQQRSCSHLYFETREGLCKLYDITSSSDTETHSMYHTDITQCNGTVSVVEAYVNDLIPDCVPGSQDEPLLESIIEGNSFFSCQDVSMIACFEGHSRCFHIAEICIHRRDQHGKLFPCRSGEHLQICKEFECNMMFKCPTFYCIPWVYICDGQWDCPLGADEVSCRKQTTCFNMFKCVNKNVCVHLGDVCNGYRDCPSGDDEKLCELLTLSCPASCNCLAFAVLCTNSYLSAEAFSSVLSFNAVLLLHNKVDFTDLKMKESRTVLLLGIQNTKLENICLMTSGMKWLTLVDASRNNIFSINSGCFSHKAYLMAVDLNTNIISSIKMFAFQNLSNLRSLNLSGNSLTALLSNYFKLCPKLSLLSVQNNSRLELKGFQKGTELHMLNLQTTHYHLCCSLSQLSSCTAKLPWYLSCSSLLANKAMKISTYSISLAVVLTNVLSIIWQALESKRTGRVKAYGITVIVVNLADILCGIYLVILWTADLYSQGDFILKEIKWRSSPVCFAAFSTVLNFCFLSPVSLCFLSYSRLTLVLNPLTFKFKEFRFIFRCNLLLFVFSSALSTTATTITKVFSRKVPTALCSPFVDPSNSVTDVKIYTWLVVMSQTFAAFYILSQYTRLIFALQKSQIEMQKFSCIKQVPLTLALQMIVITLSNILCWIPSGVVYLISVMAEKYSTAMVVWTTICVMPINSVINPLIFLVIGVKRALTDRHQRKRLLEGKKLHKRTEDLIKKYIKMDTSDFTV